MNHYHEEEKEKRGSREGIKSWAIILILVTFILGFGATVFITVGDRWPPNWNFGAIPDVPGESLFSTERTK